MSNESKPILAALLVLALSIGGAYYFKNRPPEPSLFDEGGALIEPVTAEPGQVVVGFDAGLIADKTVPVTFDSWGSSGDRLAQTISFVSAKTTRELYDAHLAYLSEHGYAISYQSFGDESYIYGQKGDERLSYSSISAPEDVSVSITRVN